MIWSGILYQIYSATDTVPLEFGGAPHVFRTTGSGKFPATADSILSPSEELQLLYPGVLDTVDRSEGLTIRWKPISDPDAKIQVRFFSFSDGDNPEVVTGASVGELPDNGSYTISAETLAAYPAGTLVVTVLRYVEKNGRSGTQRYSMKVYSEVMSLSRMIP